MDTLRRTYETNVFGVFAVTQAMLPLLKKSEAGRIVNHLQRSGIAHAATATQTIGSIAAVKPLAYNSSRPRSI